MNENWNLNEFGVRDEDIQQREKSMFTGENYIDVGWTKNRNDGDLAIAVDKYLQGWATSSSLSRHTGSKTRSCYVLSPNLNYGLQKVFSVHLIEYLRPVLFQHPLSQIRNPLKNEKENSIWKRRIVKERGLWFKLRRSTKVPFQGRQNRVRNGVRFFGGWVPRRFKDSEDVDGLPWLTSEP